MMRVSEKIAEQFATITWPVYRIKEVHDSHTHIIDKQLCVARPCPDCVHCRCPVPLDLHETP